jgi:hypothetical protein
VGLLLAGLVGSAEAQERQRGRFGGAGGPGGMFGGDMFRLVSIPEVADALKLNDDQRAYVKLLVDEINDARQKAFEGIRDLSDDERREKFRELGEKAREEQPKREKQLAEIVGDDKVKRLRQIGQQLAGPVLAFMDPKVGEELKITEDQREKSREVFDASRDEMRSLFQSAGEDREARAKAMEEFRKKQQEKVVALLTDEQKNKWKELVGEPVGDELLGKIRAASARGFGRGPGGPGGPGGPDRKGQRKKKDA